LSLWFTNKPPERPPPMKNFLRPSSPFLALALAASLLRAGEPAPTDIPAAESRTVERRGAGHPPAPQEMENGAFLGVETTTISETLTDQLNLPRRIGLVVLNISPDSPASAATLKANDILLKLNDQQLIDTYQLSVLIRNHRDGDEITLTYLRGGKEATTKAKLALRMLPKISWESEHPAAWNKDLGPERVQGMLSMMSPGLQRVAPFADDEMPETRIFKMNTGNSHVSFDDRQGALDLTIVDGQQNLVAKDTNGAILFSGPVDTPAQRKALPPVVRERFEHLESQIKIDMSYKLEGDLKDAKGQAEPVPKQSSLLRASHGISIPTLTLL
jgi:serine protease Do